MHIQPLTADYCHQQYLLSPEWKYTADHCLLWLHAKQAHHGNILPHLEQGFGKAISFFNLPPEAQKGQQMGFNVNDASELSQEAAARFLTEEFEMLCQALPGLGRTQVLMVQGLYKNSFEGKGLT